MLLCYRTVPRRETGNIIIGRLLDKKTMAYKLPPLLYPKEALEPYIDATTMEIHHDKHHGAYVTNVNKAIAGKQDLEKKTEEDLIRGLGAVPEDIRGVVRNNAGGHAN